LPGLLFLLPAGTWPTDSTGGDDPGVLRLIAGALTRRWLLRAITRTSSVLPIYAVLFSSGLGARVAVQGRRARR
jgi:hypothetical protein